MTDTVSVVGRKEFPRQLSEFAVKIRALKLGRQMKVNRRIKEKDDPVPLYRSLMF